MMRFQRYPDGGNEWTWFVWGRHPKNSATWTHSLSVSLERKGAWDAPRKWVTFRLNRHNGLGFYFRVGRLWGSLVRQKASFK